MGKEGEAAGAQRGQQPLCASLWAVLPGGPPRQEGWASGASPRTLHIPPAPWLFTMVLERKARGVSLVPRASSPAPGPCPPASLEWGLPDLWTPVSAPQMH